MTTNYSELLAEECVQLHVVNGHTYVSKLSEVKGANITPVASPGGTANFGYSVSGRTLTWVTNLATGGTAFVTIRGRL